MISILIPIYNGIEFISESVNSVLAQTYQDWEVIIGINGHEPDSEIYNIANKFASEKIKVINLYPIRGKPNSLNEMIKYCKYDWIAILDVDDIWYPEKLQKQIEYIKDYDVIGTKCQYFQDSNIIPNIPIGNITDFNFLSVNPIINSSSLIKKHLCHWKNHGVEDYDLWLKLRYIIKAKIYNIDEVLVYHRIHKQSAFNNSNNNNVPDLKKKYSIIQSTTTTVNLKGGLGNQLFQIFTLISYCIDNNRSFCFINNKVLGSGSDTIRNTYYETFLSKLQKYLVNRETINNTFNLVREEGFRYVNIQNLESDINILLDGYYQSPLYFNKNYNLIINILNINYLQNELSKKEELDYKNTISMHFRLGDYKFKQNYHNILPKTYYMNSLNHILNSVKENLEFKVLYFYEDEDINTVKETIDELKNYFTNITFIRANPNLSDWEQLLLMSLCYHNIIANSSFSWWGAYFNNNKEKIVCYPLKWFGPYITDETIDLFPETWKKINII